MQDTRDTILFCGPVCRLTTDDPPPVGCGLCPLAVFYDGIGLSLPSVREVTAEEIPEPGRQLLAHERDMTSTLEEFHGARTHLRVLQSLTRAGVYQRQVVLALDGTQQPVEFGAITIELAMLPPAARSAVIAARRPLGGILSEHGIEFVSRPRTFIRVASDDVIGRALGLRAPATLYGRCNTLFDPAGQTIADIVEILPPAPIQH
jgi:chorismate-pyruvate lyase